VRPVRASIAVRVPLDSAKLLAGVGVQCHDLSAAVGGMCGMNAPVSRSSR
jgi:hypothetical protein